MISNTQAKNPNDKRLWLGIEDEVEFVAQYGQELKLIMNPAKEYNPYCADLFRLSDGSLADLKIQREPYRTSDRYGVPSERCVTLNVYDLTRYPIQYGADFSIYFWLCHPVNSCNGIYTATCRQIFDNITFHRRKIHNYQTRTGEDSNKTHSWVLDIFDCERVADSKKIIAEVKP